MTAISTPTPVRKSIRVAVKPQRAFEVFTSGMHRWWPPGHSLLKSPRAAIVVEPTKGGRWLERAVDGSEYQWGYVIEWQPPDRVLLAWQLDAAWTFNPKLVTEVEIRFIADGTSATRVELEHRNLERYGETADAVRTSLDSADGWGLLLTQFAAATEGQKRE